MLCSPAKSAPSMDLSDSVESELLAPLRWARIRLMRLDERFWSCAAAARRFFMVNILSCIPACVQ